MLFVGFLRVCPIHPHLLRRISSSAGSWLARCHRSALLMVSDQRIWRILPRQLLMKVCTFLMVVFVVLHVSAPYRSTDLTLELNSLIFVRVDTALKLQMFFSYKYAALALAILALTSASVPPCLLMMLPRYVKASTSSSSLPRSVTGSSLAVLILRILVLPS